ncbi:MAG: class I SAM-dependent methyltransferase [Actinobacteria bacterium]|nr:MAG: class I SAM-dependent methyltransferase [Actinomycetota bacterium]
MLLRPPARQRRLQLDQREVADEAMVVAAEAGERDDADAPRADPSLAPESPDGAVSRGPSQAFEIDRADEPGERRGSARREPARAECRGRKPRERLARRRRRSAPANDRSLDLTGASRLDELAADGTQRRVRNRRRPPRSHAPQGANGVPEQRVAGEAAMELARVVVQCEHEARVLHGSLGRRAQQDRAVGKLTGRGPFAAGKIGLPRIRPGREPKRKRAFRSEPRLDHAGSLLAMPERILTRVRFVDAVSLRSRKRKLRLLLDELQPTPETTVLDVGADELGFGDESGCGTLNFFEELYPWPERITALGLHDGTGFRRRYPGIRYVQGDACALPFEDGAFDVVFSNAVIEHVGGRERQRRFVAEALRVGRRVVVTTPNRFFPVEVHTRLPLVHWLPDRIAHRAYRALGKDFATDVNLLSRRALASLFPGRVRVVSLGLTLVAIVD